MRKKIFAVSLSVCCSFMPLFLSSCGTANRQLSVEIADAKKRYYYNLGYKEGIETGEKIGKAEEEKNILLNLRKWENDIIALRVGKYLLDKGYLDKGAVYRLKDGTAVDVKFAFEGFVSLQDVDRVLESGIFIPVYNDNTVLRTTYVQAPKPSLSFLSDPMARIMYRKGFKDGYQTGYKKGIATEDKRAFSAVSEFKRKILALEISKYMNKDIFLTYPRIYRVVNGSDVKIFFIPPRIEKIRTINDIMSGIGIPIKEENREKDMRADVELPVIITEKSFSEEGENKSATLYKVHVNTGAKYLLENMNIPFLIEGDDYYAVFFDKAQMESFCRSHPGICEEK